MLQIQHFVTLVPQDASVHKQGHKHDPCPCVMTPVFFAKGMSLWVRTRVFVLFFGYEINTNIADSQNSIPSR